MFFLVRGSALFDPFFLLIIKNFKKMATFKLGAIITDIAGSIGGTTLKRNGTYKVIMNKSSGTPYSRSLNNRALGYLPFIFKQWTLLNDLQKNSWNDLALRYTFPDKFGALRNLSGRQLFIKLNAQGYYLNGSLVNPDEITSQLDVYSINQAAFIPELHQFTFAVINDSGNSQYYYVSIELSLQPLRTPTFISRQIVGVYELTGTTGVDILEDILKLYPYYSQAYNARLYVQAINTSGFKSVMQYKDVFVITSG